MGGKTTMNPRKPFADMLQSNWIRYLVIYGLLLFFCLWGLDQVPFHGDESSWISSSYTYEAFLHLDFKSDVWQESYWTLTQPPLPRYFIGLGRTLGGYDETRLNQPIDFFLTEAENIAHGAYPEASLLGWSRLPMAVLTSFSLFLLFYLVELGFGKLSSTVFLGFILFNPFLLSNLRLALGEAPLLFFTCLSMLFAVLGLKSWKAGGDPNPSAKRKAIFWFLLMGVACGLAAASKLNGAIALFAGLILLLWIGLQETEPANLRLYKWILPLLVAALAFVIFVAVNPFLYANPPLNALKMAMFRKHEMDLQQLHFPEFQIKGLAQHLVINTMNIFERFASIRFTGAWLVNGLLCLSGLAGILLQRRSKLLNFQAGILLLFMAVIALPSLFTPLNYPRYYLFPVILSLMLSSVGISFFVNQIILKWKKKGSGEISPEP
jgi:hypothetical protein